MQPGERIGPYQLAARLGAGGMGEVWEAVLHGPKGFKRPVALKLLRPSHELDGESRRGLLHEARLGALLAHPNVVAIHEAGEIDGRVFVAMELVLGVPVSRLILQAPLPPAAVRSVGEQAARGLHHCHAFEIDGEPAGLVHRDIKPRNLLVDRYGTVRVADLGIARLVGTGAQVAGTVGYMPPEQHQGWEDARADVFALGCTLYVLATLNLPFGAILLDELDLGVRLADPSLLAPAEDAVPGLGPILRRCFQPNPADRYASALDLAEALSALSTHGESLGAVVRRVLGGDADTPAAPPRRQGHLPSPDDRFVGRDSERKAIVARIDGPDRLFTLLGAGGAGKTRLALEIARDVAPDLPGGAWFCDLSGSRTARELCTVVGRTLQIPLGQSDPVAQVGLALRGRGRTLVVLDNFEQLVRDAADVVTRWAAAAPDTTLLVTSRTALRVSEERLLSLGPLDDADGVALFRERAVVVTATDPEIAHLVRQLDGLPLAIELAAARTRTMTVEEIGSNLDERFRLLAGGAASRPERHRSLRASLESSWGLLAPWEEQALAQLSVFVDGFTLEAAAAVVDLRAWSLAPPTLAVLGSAYDQSLLRVDADGRFRMLLTIRDYAAQVRRPAERAADEGRHMAYFAQFGSPDALAALDRHGGEEQRRRLGAEVEELVVAARRAVARGDGPMAAGAALAAWAVLYERGPVEVGLEVLELALTLSPPRSMELRAERGVALAMLHRNDEARVILDAVLAECGDRDPIRIRALLRLAAIDQVANRHDEARRGLTDALTQALALGDRRSEGEAQTGLGSLLQREARPAEAAFTLRTALEIQRAIGDRRSEANTQILLALALRDLDLRDDAQRQLEEALEIARRLGSVGAEARALGNLGILQHEGGHLDEAERLYLAALALHRAVGQPRSEAITLGNLGTLHRLRGRLDDAVQALEASIAGHLDGGDRLFQGHAVANLGNVLRDAGRPREAMRRYDTAIYLYHSVGAVRQALRAMRYAARTTRVLGQHEDEIARLERVVALAQENDLRIEAAKAGGELVLARVAAGDVEVARRELITVAGMAEGDTYATAIAAYARGALRARDDPRGIADLKEAVGLLETLNEPVTLGGCLLALSTRLDGTAGPAVLDRAAAILRELPVPEAVELLRALADREADPERARNLRAQAEAKAVAIGVPAGVGLRAG